MTSRLDPNAIKADSGNGGPETARRAVSRHETSRSGRSSRFPEMSDRCPQPLFTDSLGWRLDARLLPPCPNDFPPSSQVQRPAPGLPGCFSVDFPAGNVNRGAGRRFRRGL